MNTFRAAASLTLLTAGSMAAAPVLAQETGRHSGMPESAPPDDRAYGDTASPDDSRESALDDAPPEDGEYGNTSSDGPQAELPDNAARKDRENRDDQAIDDSRAGDSFDAAIDACAGEIERGGRHIGSVDNVHHAEDRYSVEGRLDNGPDFACTVDDAGRVHSARVDGHELAR